MSHSLYDTPKTLDRPEKYTFIITVKHTPEILDRVIAPVRKRGILINHFTFQRTDHGHGLCILTFRCDQSQINRIGRNFLRIEDAVKVEVFRGSETILNPSPDIS